MQEGKYKYYTGILKIWRQIQKYIYFCILLYQAWSLCGERGSQI